MSRALIKIFCACASSNGLKPGDKSASNGKCPSTDWQKEWMVIIFKPPGVSTTPANNFRAAVICSCVASCPNKARKLPTSPFCSLSLSSASNGMTAHSLSRAAIRKAISLAAALVKVSAKILCGAVPALPVASGSKSRNIRSVKTLVFPDPADAPTQTEEAG